MAENTQLTAQARDRAGKGVARALRREGRVPAVVYGDKKSPDLISLSHNEVTKLWNRGSFMSALLDLEVDGKTQRVIPRDVQLDPVKDFVTHVDFLRLGKGAKIAVEVSVNFLNDEESPGIKRGGILNVVRYEVELNCPAESIPESIDVDLTGTDIGDSIHISAITLPEGVTPVITDRDFTVATIAAPAALVSEEQEAEEGEGEEGEATATEGEGEDNGDSEG
ncbi:MAG: 50S ribosomal protein L25/general stress protein Ctc [Parvibaculaceae bacterium]|jgi:large subunit ribosomal protein L25|nr:50S ribosomal protein L25/general stress protein Ctc [Parvibaculaceae bacterium]HBM89634.1 50S ribosomal protein L25 [Rhodobiaceae bacterium]|tara:strand:- start:625 stop:1293 length:669 start_codon:yes stop_codon:yes gene_type:complete